VGEDVADALLDATEALRTLLDLAEERGREAELRADYAERR
jgi:hypothetical protein